MKTDNGIYELLPNSWRFEIARHSSFKVPGNLKDELHIFSSLYDIDIKKNIWKRKIDNTPALKMALTIGMPVHQIMRAIKINMKELQGGIEGIAEEINKQLKVRGLIPATCKLMVLASLQLRNISDPTSWASKPFPIAPIFFYSSDIKLKSDYENHISALREVFPTTGLSDFQTVTGSLCDGGTNISSLLVMVKDKYEYSEIADGILKIIVKDEDIIKHISLSKKIYETFHSKVERNIICNNTDVPVYATMLLGLLRHSDVMVVTANNICLEADKNHPRGLAGFILCFGRGDEVEQFFPLAAELYVPLIHLYAKAALLEGAQHFYDSKANISNALSGLKLAIDQLQKQRENLHEHIGDSYGEDLARFRDDLEFKIKDDSSLVKMVFNNVRDKGYSPGSRGIWHTNWAISQERSDSNNKTRLDKLKDWLQRKCPGRYLHLWDDKRFQTDFVEKVNDIQDENDWDQCFNGSGENRLELLLLSRCHKLNNETSISGINDSLPLFRFHGFEIFFPHLKDIISGIKRNFPNAEASIDKDRFVVLINASFDKEKIALFSKSVKNEINRLPFAEWTRTSYMLLMWAKLYHRKAEAVWLNDEDSIIATLAVNEKGVLSGPNFVNSGTFKCTKSKYHFFFAT